MIEVTAVFDIGKTNKKFFLFDEHYKEVHREYVKFDHEVDEEGYPCENLTTLQNWLKNVFSTFLESRKYSIKAINFSTYGASLVHLDYKGKPITVLYNYTKPFPDDIKGEFLDKYGPEDVLWEKTGCGIEGFLNSGLQLFWLKRKRPKVFDRIRYSLHLPQYLSYVFTGIPVSEYTSIGCHTLLWDYSKKDYHHWVYKEGLHKKLAPIVSTETSFNMNYNGKRIKIGVGIHDSSAALLPYIRSIRKNFVLLSTGTWSIALNPFTQNALSKSNMDLATINYMRVNGKAVKSTRIFLGNEYKLQVKKLSMTFNAPFDYHKKVKFDYNIYFEISENFQHQFCWESLYDEDMPEETNISYDSFEYAYHQLMTELVLLQVKSIKKVVGEDKIKKLYIDGGFSDNDVYVKLLSHYLKDMELRTTDSSLGSALGAAMVISDTKLNPKFLKTNYALRKHVPFLMK